MRVRWIMVIRVALPRDADALVPLFDALGHPATSSDLARRLERLGADPSYVAWVACFAEDQIAGFAAGHVIHPIEDDAPAAQLIALVADPRHAGRGVGAALCRAFETWARAEGARRAIVNSNAKRTDAHRFYEGQGFVRTGLRFNKLLIAD